jgi:hypothetical protein
MPQISPKGKREIIRVDCEKILEYFLGFVGYSSAISLSLSLERMESVQRISSPKKTYLSQLGSTNR